MTKQAILKLIALLCALTMAFSVAGCTRVEETEVWLSGDDATETIIHSSGNKEDSDTENDAQSQTDGGSDKATDKNSDKDTTDKSATNADNGNKEVDINLKGATVTIGYYLTGNGGKPEADALEELALKSEIEKKYNCKIEFKTASGTSIDYYNAWAAAAMAGVKYADIIQISTGEIYPKQMKAGYLTKLDDYIDVNSIVYNQNAMKQLKYNGGTYATVMSYRYYTPRGIFFNRKLVGKNTIEDLVNSNKWTWSNFRKIANDATKKEQDVQYYGYGYRGTDATFWAMANGGQKVTNVSGKYKFTMLSDTKYLKGLEFVYDLVNVDKVSPPDAKSSGSLWKAGKVAMYLDLPGYGPEYMEAIGEENLGFTYIPRPDDAKDYNITVEETTAFAIPSTVKNPEVIAKIMYDWTAPKDWRPSAESQHENNFADDFSRKCAGDIAMRASKNISLKPNYDYITSVANSGYGITELQKPSTYLATVEAAAQAELDEVWAQ